MYCALSDDKMELPILRRETTRTAQLAELPRVKQAFMNFLSET
jgi:hypothetical protein